MIGMIGAIVCSLVSELMERFGKKYVDDTLDVFACHGVGKCTSGALGQQTDTKLCSGSCTALYAELLGASSTKLVCVQQVQMWHRSRHTV